MIYWKKFSLLPFLLILSLFFFPSCQSTTDTEPPSNPEDESRYTHPRDKVDLVYDSKLELYKVEGYPRHYYHEGFYYRYSRGNWAFSRDLKDPQWRPAGEGGRPLPPGLRDKSKLGWPAKGKGANPKEVPKGKGLGE